MQLIVQTLYHSPRAKLDRLLSEHAPVASHCPTCRTVWPCTLWAAGQAASERKRSA